MIMLTVYRRSDGLKHPRTRTIFSWMHTWWPQKGEYNLCNLWVFSSGPFQCWIMHPSTIFFLLTYFNASMFTITFFSSFATAFTPTAMSIKPIGTVILTVLAPWADACYIHQEFEDMNVRNVKNITNCIIQETEQQNTRSLCF